LNSQSTTTKSFLIGLELAQLCGLHNSSDVTVTREQRIYGPN